MKLKKILVFIVGLTIIFSEATAQYQQDAFNFSNQIYGSTSRSLATGGSLSAVGADLSVMATNPAGLALLKSNHFTFGTVLIMNSASSSFRESSQADNKYGFTVNNFGYAWARRNENSDWKGFSIGLAYNQLADYRQDKLISGTNSTGSVLDYFVYNANNSGTEYESRSSSFREDLAYETYLLELDGEEYYSFVTDEETYGENQRRAVSESGGKGELDFSMAWNYADIVSFGFTVGTQFINYDKKVNYSEYGYDDIYRLDTENDSTQVDPEEMEFTEDLRTEGTGINIKGGIIVQPLKFWRLSAAVHSRTLTALTENYHTGMYSEFSTPDINGDYDYFAGTDNNIYTWNLQQPMRYNVGTAFILDQYPIGKFYTLPMIFSFEYEYTDYSTMRLKTTDGSDAFDRENDMIAKLYKETHNMRAGLELNFGKIKIRGGYALYPSAYKDDTGLFDNARVSYSGGLSFAGSAGYIDVAYSISQLSSSMGMYGAGISYPADPIGEITEPTATFSEQFQYITLTFGLR
ncbi:MAG: hypothetical protein U9N85_07705 [Bacteroidota bacterium]|nr:hypothetical protein [Bacteroidota bacterium]